MPASQTKKHKSACDQCNASKVKCPGGGVPCQRCADSSQPCHYSLARRIGKPPGSRNRKTLEKIRQAKEGSLDNTGGGGGGGGDSSVPQHKGSPNDYDEVLEGVNERQEENETRDPPQMLNTASFWPLSPLTNYTNFPDASQFIPTSDQHLLEGDHNMSLDAGERSVFQSADPNFLDLGLRRREATRIPWVDALDDCWNSSPASSDPQLSTAPTDTSSPRSAYSQTNKPISLDTVAARLEETAGSTITQSDQQQSTLCQCLRKYTDILCKLQTIEKRQHPVQVDTLLTCANLVLTTIENQLKCTYCLFDSCVAMQLVMIFQTIFTWSQSQSHSPGTPAPELRVTLGHHEMTEEECNFVKNALVSKALNRASVLLKPILSRIERIISHGQGKQSWDHEGAEFWNIQRLVSSLVQKIDILSKRLASEQSKSRQVAET